MSVKAWRELVTIPTYEIGKAEKSPMFLEKRVYQGSSGVVYPYPVIESIANEPTPHEWNVVFLENEYIKVMVMPELGGRIQMAYDKIKQRHFVYYNHVIKPALVGLCGPWISGGIEFNWPQHHRPSTYLPVDSTIVENKDGSITVWVNEMERMFHQKGMAGFTLRPGCAYLEIQGRVSNRTPLPQTFLWWANPAVEVNDAYQSVFPPDVNAVFDHGKRAVSSFPVATGTYYKMDYSAGVDISNYKNIKVPTSYMAVNSKYDFEGGYENDTKGGMLHVASHHFSPGKKQWTWGNGDFGRAWDRNLTDSIDNGQLIMENGHADTGETDNYPLSIINCSLSKGYRPYIELMAGVYTENQPDFTWLMTYEEKQFVQYFMPYRELGIVKQASKDFVLNIAEEGNNITFKILATSKQIARVALHTKNGEMLFDQETEFSPEKIFVKTVDAKGAALADIVLSVGRLQWQAEPDEIRPIPDAAEAALKPEDTKTNDQLYLTGLHLEQYRHATWSALDYYEEALRRDPNDVRCLNQTGLWYLRRGRFDKAETYLRKAVKIWQKRNPNPYDGEAIYNLALTLKYQGRVDEAYELFWKATWNKACADAAYFDAARISVLQGRYDDALDELNRCLIFNSCNHQARALKAAVLRKLDRTDEALALIDESLACDRFNYVCRYEQYLLTGDKALLQTMKQMMQPSAQHSVLGTLCNAKNYDETALEYCAAGLFTEAQAIWHMAIDEKATTPMTWYYLFTYCKEAEALETAEKADAACCFPNRLEDIHALMAALTANPNCSKAAYYLGCLYYDKRQYDLAIENWERSAEINPAFPTVWRNLALARFNKHETSGMALENMERAFRLDETDSRMLMELDQLYKRLHRDHHERLAFLEKHLEQVWQRDDLVLEMITLQNQLGRYEEAYQNLDDRIFHPWEGGEGKVPAQYQICRVEMAKDAMASGDKQELERAIRLLNECLVYPPHLGEGKLHGAQDNDFYYLLGRAYDMLGQSDKARECYEQGTAGPTEPAAAMYYNDAKPDKIFYAGLCYRALGQEDKARGLFNKLLGYGKQHLFDHVTMDYFAVSLPDLLIWEDSLDQKNLIHCKYMLALGYAGMGDKTHAERFLNEVEALDNNHQGIQQLRTFMKLMPVL